jgi:hypothetical protein
MGGPISVHFIEQYLALDESRRTFELVGLAFAEGNVNADDCFGSGKIVKQSIAEYRNTFKVLLDSLRSSEENNVSGRSSGGDPWQVSELSIY